MQEPTTQLIDMGLLVAAKAAVGAYLLHLGFSHVSDDDYARTVIAEQFAYAPRLDPSATSWLPLPFWITGMAMIVFGRSVEVGRAVSATLSAFSVAAPYAAMRCAGVARWTSIVATAVAMALPWNGWLGAASVPEAWAGAVAASAIIAMGERRAWPWCSFGLLAASLSRYEAWPASAWFAIAILAMDVRGRPSRLGAWPWALVAIAGPAAWIVWNVHAHGDPFHFVARVTAFRRAAGPSGGAAEPIWSKVLAYPRALAAETPEVAALGLLGGLAMGASRALRRTWGTAAIGAMTVLAFLILGDVRDGAPTHHPERALSIVWWVLVGAGIDAGAHTMAAARRLAEAGAPLVVASAAAAGILWAVSLPSRWRAFPGTSPWDQRESQIARGLDLRKRSVAAADITPCAFEHFAVLAAWGSPERARVHPATHEPPFPPCPRIELP